MAKSKGTGGTIERAAEAVGQTLGTISVKVEELQAQHPDPVGEAKGALAAGQVALSNAVADAGATAAAVVKKTKRVARRARKVVRRAGVRAKAAVRRGARKAARGGKKVVAKGRAGAAKAKKAVKKTARKRGR